MYLGDRFTSLLLGLPYGVTDHHFVFHEQETEQPYAVLQHRFLHRCAILAGNIIDQHNMPGPPLHSAAMALHEQSVSIESSMPKDWWNLPAVLSGSQQEQDEVRQRVLLQCYLFHIRIYIHLPFMGRSSPSPSTAAHEQNRQACLDACRDYLRYNNYLRTEIDGNRLYECSTNEYVAFQVSVIFIVGTSGKGSKTSPEDLQLIRTYKDGLRLDEGQAGCVMATQCRRVLDVLLGEQFEQFEKDNISEPDRIMIPYLGTILKRPTVLKQSPMSQDQESTLTDTTSTPGLSTHSQDLRQLGIVDAQAMNYGLFHPQNDMFSALQWELDGIGNATADVMTSWQDEPLMDIDMEWCPFLGAGQNSTENP
ncbi:hypothetical protein NA57DRAFT_77007 [Rhizodiscina lignyota]|uniref:Uncharacterized protein n=1 Tax=Rhizodiscina lignyota TaxID=1504668 RepID=A0A9P4M5T5_9PEZI|nr:hypothetical protein NA57DRAFT_77007 [Rhizodiscina lignyota]